MDSDDVVRGWGPRPASGTPTGPSGGEWLTAAEGCLSIGCGCILPLSFVALILSVAHGLMGSPSGGAEREFASNGSNTGAFLAAILIAGLILTCLSPFWLNRKAGEAPAARDSEGLRQKFASGANPRIAVLQELARRRQSIYLGNDRATGVPRFAYSEHCVVVLGPPRSGKTSSIVIPTILSAPGAVVITSTKRDVLDHTLYARSGMGRIWVYDPSSPDATIARGEPVRWSPVTHCGDWDRARSMASAMVDVADHSKDIENGNYWRQSAKVLLAPLLHAAALSGSTIVDVRSWMARGHFAYPLQILTEMNAVIAREDLEGINGLKERGSIISTARLALDAYSSETVQRSCVDPNFRADKFVRSSDALYIVASSLHQQASAPLIAGLLEELAQASYDRASQSDRAVWPPVVWALDEIANIAPISSLPNLLSQGGGQGIQILACFQDLSQARVRWNQSADGFLTMFNCKVVFPGVADRETLEALSVAAGEWDRPYTTFSSSSSTGTGNSSSATDSHGKSSEVRRERMLSPSDISTIAAGSALFMSAEGWTRLTVRPYYKDAIWSRIASATGE